MSHDSGTLGTLNLQLYGRDGQSSIAKRRNLMSDFFATHPVVRSVILPASERHAREGMDTTLQMSKCAMVNLQFRQSLGSVVLRGIAND
jgi:hypothetical protein